MTRTRRTLACAALAATLALSGCSTTVSLKAADDANNPKCADVMVLLPSTVSTVDRVWTDAQSTASWGGPPSAVILACGVTPPGPSTDPCITFSGVDWIVTDGKDHVSIATTFGRTPAVRLLVDTTKVDFNAVLNSISSAATKLTKTGECTSAQTPAS